MSPRLRSAGPIDWMARHSVAANLLMLVLILGGVFMTSQIRQELFPSYELDTVTVSVALPGAAPEEVEQSIILAIEEEMRPIEGIDKLTATAGEGSARIVAELSPDEDRQLVYNNIQQAVARITTFPDEAERPRITLDARRREVVELHVFGDVDQRSLRMAAEHVRSVLLQHDGISQVDLSGTPALEIHVEIGQAALRAHGLTLREVAASVRAAAIERGGGTVESPSGDVLIRLDDRRGAAREFATIPVVSDRRGTVVRLGDIAEVREGFADGDLVSSFNRKPSIRINVYRVGDETPITVSDAVKGAVPLAMSTLPEAIDVVTLNDRSTYYRDRMNLLLKNGFIGLCLVLLILSLFLEYKLAFWVAAGIPTAFLGTLLFLPAFGASINMVSMFAFILALGIVVDDAIVAGENIYEYLERGMSRIDAAIQGARDIAVPLSFSILTNIVAFVPLALVPGTFGKFWVVIPMVVSAAFILSWIEALYILPAHLAGVKRRDPMQRPSLPIRIQQAFSRGLAWVIHRLYGPLLRVAMDWRYVTVALMIAILAVTSAWPLTGRMGWGLFPEVPRDYAEAVVTMPVGAPLAAKLAVRDRVIAAAERVIAANGGDRLGEGIYALVDGARVEVAAFLRPPETRPLATEAFAQAWRAELGSLPEARSVRFDFAFGGPGGGSGIEIRLSHADVGVLARAARELAQRLGDFASVRDPEDGFTPGKAELAFRLTEAGRSLGLTSEVVAAQVRAAFLGAEALAQQDGRNEVTVRVRLPESERRSEATVETLLIRTPDGGEVPLFEVATVERGRAEAAIRREEGRRVITVTANVDPPEETAKVIASVTGEVLPQLRQDHPGLGYSLEGRQAAQRDTMDSFFTFSIPLALLIIYALLAIPFRSYWQPAIVMTAIPFGFAGAVLGHLIMGMSLSVISVFGIIALGGVVINAALVMIDYANKARATGVAPAEAIWRAGIRRFRPILLTTMTTFCGLAPMIFETSRQAQFLIPMAVSLGYGIVFATSVVLFLIPCLYLILDDIRALARPEQPGPDHPLPPRPSEGRVAAE
ncbi:MAG TPA: efflux RND transporter permease subunit [Thermohalobaculum sp.]|nr:efflux RND transporter permease subunit [Thermohalobaculum sp.]